MPRARSRGRPRRAGAAAAPAAPASSAAAAAAAALALSVASLAACAAAAAPPPPAPNVVFLICESTQAAAYARGGSPAPLPNIARLRAAGALSFGAAYPASPVCCPSRASLWSGRHAHHVPHVHNGLHVGGAWNNYEGLAAGYADKARPWRERERTPKALRLEPSHTKALMRRAKALQALGRFDWGRAGAAQASW